MPPFRSLSLLLLLSLPVMAGLAALTVAFDGAAFQRAYAVLSVHETVPDRELRERLAVFGEGIISESSQWVLLDDFGGLERLPLDEYASRLLPQDPRNDGYAERLRSFFVRDGKRLLFIPSGGVLPGALEKRLALLLDGVPYTIAYLGGGKPLAFFLLLFILGSLSFFCIRPLRSRAPLVPCLPLLAPLALNGAGGFALAAILASCLVLLRPPCFELTMLFSRRPPRKERLRLFLRDVYEPYRARWLLVPVFGAAYTLTAAAADIHPLGAAGVFAACAGMFVLSLKHAARGRARHIRFSPLPIQARHSVSFGFLAAAIPFAAAALCAVFIAPVVSTRPAAVPALLAGGVVISEAEYRAHVDFQASFSLRALGGQEDARSYTAYTEYTLGPDGLIVPAAPPPGGFKAGGLKAGGLKADGLKAEAIPPFPLKELMEFLRDSRGGN
jgi:hypothetical protein